MTKWLFTDLDNPIEQELIECEDPVAQFCLAQDIEPDAVLVTWIFEEGEIKLIIEDVVKIESAKGITTLPPMLHQQGEKPNG